MSEPTLTSVPEFLAAIAQEATRSPNSIALEIKSHSKQPLRISYSELVGSTWSAAKLLREDGIKKVAVLSGRSPTRYLSVLSSAWAGAEILPISADWPNARMLYALEEFQPDLIWVDASFESRLREMHGRFSAWANQLRVQSFDVQLGRRADSICDRVHAMKGLDWDQLVSCKASAIRRPFYRVMTSGSTGQPKFVCISTENFQSYWKSLCSWHELKAEQRVSQIFDLSFDLAWHDLFSTWSRGGTLVVPSREALMHPIGFLREADLDELFMTPTWAASFLLSRGVKGFELPRMRRVMFCGEPLTRELLKAAQTSFSNAAIWNVYGPSETTVAVTHFDCAEDFPAEQNIVPIGRAFGDNRIEIFDGQIHIAGPQVAEFAERVAGGGSEVTHGPSAGLAWFATGDCGGWSASESTNLGAYINFAGRKDRQVKVRGHRLELAEVENQAWRCALRLDLDIVALQVELIGSAIVLICQRGHGLITERTATQSEEFQSALFAKWRDALAQELPAYAVPQHWLERPDWPTTPSGKTDLLTNRNWAMSRIDG